MKPALEPAGGIGQQQVAECAERGAVEREAEREDPPVVGRRQRAEQPETAGGDEKETGPVVGPPPVCDQAAEDKGEAGDARQRGDEDLVATSQIAPAAPRSTIAPTAAR